MVRKILNRLLNARRPDPFDFTERDKEIIRKVQPYTMTNKFRIKALCEAVDYLVSNEIGGDFVECGVWRGGSVMAMEFTLQDRKDSSRHIYMFDTFEGMTAPSTDDVSVHHESAASLLSKTERNTVPNIWCYAPIEEVKGNFATVGISEDRLHFVKGPVENTLPSGAPPRIAFLRVDTDWYTSTKHIMGTLYERVVSKGVVLFDDYGYWRGARRAIDEFFANHSYKPFLHRIDETARLLIKP